MFIQTWVVQNLLSMSQFKHFVGIDVSKDNFDVAFHMADTSLRMSPVRLHNTVQGVKELLRLLVDQKVALEEVLFCMENTGSYSSILTATLWNKGANVWLEHACSIKRSMGIQRGKTDRVDAVRIAEYAARFSDKARLYQPANENLLVVKELLSVRKKLLKYATGLKVHLQEMKRFHATAYKEAKASTTRSIKQLERDQAAIDARIDEIIKEDTALRQVYKVATSVTGVGRVTVLYLMCATELFTKCGSARQLACYCGVVPFEYTSGKSVRKTPKVHYMANKELKCYLQMCAMSAVRYDPQIRAYYQRKVEEGKNKMLVLNNVRNKLIHRIYAVVEKNERYARRIA